MDYVVPKDLPLALPAPPWLILSVLLIFFAAHILFVNLMVGGSIAVLITEIVGLRKPDWDRISRAIADTLTVNKSIAVVLGVGPLLAISVYYTPQFYTANTLTGHTWLMVIPLVTAAFLLTYLHKYTWDRLVDSKALHISMVAGATAIFLFVPFIFLANINLMLYPEHWRNIHSFLDAMVLPNVIPRYFHFISASMAIMGLFLVKWMGRESKVREMGLETIDAAEVRRRFYTLTLGATGAQLFFGPLLFLTLPGHVISMTMVTLVLTVITLASWVVLWLWREVTSDNPGTRFWHIVGMLSIIVTLMVWVRHDIRETAVAPHRELVRIKTLKYTAEVEKARGYLVMPGGLGGEPVSPGMMKFLRSCGSCHAIEKKLVGPPLSETGALYSGDPDGIVAWALNPGRRRSDYPAMAAVVLPREDLLEIANYILGITGNQ